MAIEAVGFKEGFAYCGVAGGFGGAAGHGELAEVSDELPGVQAGEGEGWHGGAGDAFGDGLEESFVGAAVAEGAGVEGGAGTSSLPCWAVAAGALFEVKGCAAGYIGGLGIGVDGGGAAVLGG